MTAILLSDETIPSNGVKFIGIWWKSEARNMIEVTISCIRFPVSILVQQLLQYRVRQFSLNKIKFIFGVRNFFCGNAQILRFLLCIIYIIYVSYREY